MKIAAFAAALVAMVDARPSDATFASCYINCMTGVMGQVKLWQKEGEHDLKINGMISGIREEDGTNISIDIQNANVDPLDPEVGCPWPNDQLYDLGSVEAVDGYIADWETYAAYPW